MPVPLPVAIPAAAAGLAYLSARASLPYDLNMVRGVVPAGFKLGWRGYKDRISLFYSLESRAQSSSHANHLFLIHEDKKYTYAEVYQQALRYANWLRNKHGIKKKDVVAIDFQNSDIFIFLVFGLWAIGAKPAFINYNLTGDALIHCIKTATPVLLLVDPELTKNVNEDVKSRLDGLPIDFLTPDVLAEITTTEPIRPPDDLRSGDQSHDMAILIYTSGTTGLPKAAVVSWAKLTVAGAFTGGWIGTKKNDVFYTCMPLYHSSATIMGFCHSLEAGCTLAIGKKFSTKKFWKEVRRYDATIIQYVGETCRYLLAAPSEIDPVTGENLDKKNNVRVAFGNGLRPDVWGRFKERFGIDTVAEFYAATEGMMGTWNLSRNEFSQAAIGRSGFIYGLIFRKRVAVAEIDDETEQPRRDPKTGFCTKAKSGEPGEMLFHLPVKDTHTRYQGYYGNEKATDGKLMRDVFSKGDLWFRSGDLVRWDREGRLYFHDRIGDTFRWKSENVSTSEVSQMMGLHPLVTEANVYGVQLSHHDGRAGCVAIVLKADPSPELLKSLADHAQKTLPKYALPIFLRVVKDLESSTTGTNKQQKHILRVQGVDPDKVGADEMYWLRNGTYVTFDKGDWENLNGGKTKL